MPGHFNAYQEYKNSKNSASKQHKKSFGEYLMTSLF